MAVLKHKRSNKNGHKRVSGGGNSRGSLWGKTKRFFSHKKPSIRRTKSKGSVSLRHKLEVLAKTETEIESSLRKNRATIAALRAHTVGLFNNSGSKSLKRTKSKGSVALRHQLERLGKTQSEIETSLRKNRATIAALKSHTTGLFNNNSGSKRSSKHSSHSISSIHSSSSA